MSSRPSRAPSAPLTIDDDLAIDFPRRAVIVRGETIKLRPTEYRLLLHLVENAGWIVPQETLLSKVWGPEYRDDNQLLRLYITYLRKKIEPDPAHPKYILTERGVGYQFMDYKRSRSSKAGADSGAGLCFIGSRTAWLLHHIHQHRQSPHRFSSLFLDERRGIACPARPPPAG